MPVLLDELEDARRLVLRVRDVPGMARGRLARVRGDDQHRNPETQAALIVEKDRRLVIVQAAPVVPENDDRAGLPEAALPDRVNDRSDPRRPVIDVFPSLK